MDQRRFQPIDPYAGMNRKQRRQAERDTQRGIDRSEKIVSLPPAIDEFTIFDIPQTILDRCQAGEIEAAAGVPIFRDNTGSWNEVCPALDGWIFTWQRISDVMQLQLDLDPLRRLHKKLDRSMPITESDVQAAQTALYATRLAFRRNDRKRIASLAKDAQIAILMEGWNHGR